MQSKDIIEVLGNYEAISFIDSHINDDVALLSLKYQGKVSYNLTVSLQLIAIYKKARKKLPTFWSSKLALNLRSYEQASSEAVAAYKARFIRGDSFLDITGGLGVDSLALSRGFKSAVAVEINEELHDLAVYNANKLGAPLVRVLGDGIAELVNRKVTWLYIDPDRRSAEKRIVDINHLIPNVIELLPLIESQATYTYIKLSPLYDIKEAYRQFENLIEIHLIAERNEMKEVGLVLGDIEGKECQVILSDVNTGFYKEIYWASLGRSVMIGEYDVYQYMHIPLSLVAKASAASSFASQGMIKHTEFELFFSNKSTNDGFRNFKVCYQGSLSTKTLKKALKDLNIKKLNIIIKGSKETADIWHKKLSTTDGGDFYMVLCKGKKKAAYITELTF